MRQVNDMKDRKIYRKLLTLLLLLCLAMSLSGCKTQAVIPEAKGLPLQHEPEFGGIYLEMTIDDFNKLGFSYGDSVKVTFSNGYVLEDLPYYNGYYVDVGEPLLVAYPGYPYIKAGINNGDDLWNVAGLDENCTGTVTLNEHGTYLEMQLARDIHYTDKREDYPSDEVFANFRNVEIGNMREGIFYRSASPCDNQHARASYVDALISEAGVNFILNLADNEEKIEGYIAKEDFASPYFLSLYENGQVLPLALNMNYGSEEFQAKLVRGFSVMAENDGPYLIHCTEGKDRTGFVCMLLEALAGAGYREIADDYMETYANYYKITKESDPTKYDIILEKNLNDMIRVIAADPEADVEKVDMQKAAEDFLLRIGMEEETLGMLKGRLNKPALFGMSPAYRRMLPAFLLWTLLALLFIGIGIYVRKMNRPAAFFAFRKEGPQVTDIQKYNRSVSTLWIVCGLLLELLGLPLLYVKQNSLALIIPILGTVFLCLALAIGYTKIYARYKAK